MNTTSSPENKGIIGPTPDDIETSNKLTGPIKRSRLLGAVAGILGIPLATSTLAACASPKAAIVETVPVSDSGIKVIPVSTNPETVEPAKPEVKYYPIEAKDPVDPFKRVSFQFVETKLPSGSKYGVMFADKTQREYKTALTQDSKDRKFHIEYIASAVDQEEKGLSFIDFELQLDSWTNETPEQTGQRALQAWEKGQISKITLRDQKNSIAYTVKKDRNLLQQVLSLFPVKVALAEELEEEPATKEPELTPTPADTKPTVAPATATPEAQEDVPCVILPEKYCSQGEVVYIKNSLGETGAYIGFNLPVGTPIFAGKTGLALKAEIKQPHPLQGFLVSIRDSNGVTPNSTAVDAVGDLKLDNMLSLPADEGKPIATIQDTGVKVFGKFNFVTTISRLDPSLGRAVSALDLLKQLYPEAFAKPAINAESKTPDKSASTVLSPMFANSNTVSK